MFFEPEIASRSVWSSARFRTVYGVTHFYNLSKRFQKGNGEEIGEIVFCLDRKVCFSL